jgi:Saxitoxin biosynthesis operon protein SxtJ
MTAEPGGRRMTAPRAGSEELRSSDRAFGLTFTGFLTLVALWPLWRGGPVRTWALAGAGAFLLVALAWPALLAPLNRVWTNLGLVLHRIVNPIVMGIMFYGVITPMGVIMRWAGRDALRLRRNPAAATYWIDRHPPGPAPDTMTNQF